MTLEPRSELYTGAVLTLRLAHAALPPAVATVEALQAGSGSAWLG